MSTMVDEEHANLWTLAFPPLIWAAHFLLSYCTAAIWCAKYAGASNALGTARLAVFIYTALALVALLLSGLAGYRKQRLGRVRAPHDRDTAEDRYRFLGYAAMLLSGLSAIAVCYAALVVVFIRSCE
jgi:hypothetical protein